MPNAATETAMRRRPRTPRRNGPPAPGPGPSDCITCDEIQTWWQQGPVFQRVVRRRTEVDENVTLDPTDDD